MVIGLTGGIGAGKSTILNILKKEFGFTVIETDRIAHELMEKGQPVYEEITACFGREILDEKQQIDRRKLGAIVFEQKKMLKKLNEIVHPEVILEMKKRIATKSPEQGRFVIESALLFESGCQKLCDSVWYVDTKESIRRERLKTNRGMTDEQIDRVLRQQTMQEQNRRMSDIRIDNSDDVGKTTEQIHMALEKILEFQEII